MEINKAGIIGLGLIGGSLAKALKKRYKIKSIVAFNRRESPLIQAFKDGVIDAYTTELNALFSDCDVVFICTPVDKIKDYALSLAKIVKASCIITDAGSTKSGIMAQIGDMEGIHFIGGHPMAGSEKTGYEAAKEYLFENAYYILTPGPDTPPEMTAALQSLAHAMGAIPIVIDAGAHDYAVAGVSHAPHIIASALVNTVKRIDQAALMHTIAAGGFKDITRIASSSPAMWHSISFENRDEILKVLDVFEQELKSFREKLSGGESAGIKDFFSQAKEYRDSFKPGSSGAFLQSYEIYVDILDKPGSIATVATMLSVNNINIKNIGIINNREYENGVLQILFATRENMEKSIQLLEEMNFLVYRKD